MRAPRIQGRISGLGEELSQELQIALRIADHARPHAPQKMLALTRVDQRMGVAQSRLETDRRRAASDRENRRAAAAASRPSGPTASLVSLCSSCRRCAMLLTNVSGAWKSSAKRRNKSDADSRSRSRSAFRTKATSLSSHGTSSSRSSRCLRNWRRCADQLIEDLAHDRNLN